MSTVFFTADLHIGHKKVSQLRGFKTPEEHDAHIVSVWNSTVTNRDTVYVLGDIALSNYDHALDLIENQLNGTKHLISGNHDIVHPMHKRGHSRAELLRWLDAFETINPFLRKTHNHMQYLLSHFPYAEWGDGESREGSRYDQFRLPDRGVPLIHGHTHGKERMHGSFVSSHLNNMLHVGWDAWGEPVHLKHIEEWLESQPSFSSFEHHID